jgi:hypothetical protein
MMPTDGLRPIVESVDREMARLLVRPDSDTGALLAAWARLIDYLALGPALAIGRCPFCGSVSARAATRCGTCWAKLVPPPPPASA